jgi:hypothetical protein
MNCHIPVPPLPPEDRDAIVRAFRAALRQARAVETAKLRLTLYKLELVRDGMREINADLRAGRWP